MSWQSLLKNLLDPNRSESFWRGLCVLSITAVFSSSILWADFAAARLIKLPPIATAVANADAVVLVEILEVTELNVLGAYCGTRTRARVLESFKETPGTKGAAELIFGRSSDLEPGQKYILFLNKIIDTERIYKDLPEEFRTGYPRAHAFQMIECHGMVPGLIFNNSLVWDIVGEFVRMYGLPPRSWPESITIIEQTSNLGVHDVSKAQLFNYLRELRPQGL